MNKKIMEILGDAERKEDGQAKLFIYRSACIPVKANALQLVQVVITTGGEEHNLENVADVTMDPDNKDYAFRIYPKNECYWEDIKKGILESQPYMKLEDKMEEELKYILCTMPEVNKDIHDVFTNLLNGFYTEAKAKIDLANVTSVAQAIPVAAGNSLKPEEDITEVKDEAKGVYDAAMQQVEDENERKKQEIEEAYQKYCEEHPEGAENQSKDKSGDVSLLMNAEDDE